MSNQSEHDRAGITRTSLLAIFERMDDAAKAAGSNITLCVFGASAVLLYGSEERQTQDIDVWRPASSFNDRSVKAFAAAAGLDVNPTSLAVDRIYLQIVTDGVVRLPDYDPQKALWPGDKPSETLWSGDALTIVAPPPAIIAAAKMVRSDVRDIDDVLLIMARRGVTRADISKALRTFPADASERGRDNLVLLDVTLAGRVPDTPDKTKGKEPGR